jgi:hypothetical protein
MTPRQLRARLAVLREAGADQATFSVEGELLSVSLQGRPAVTTPAGAAAKDEAIAAARAALADVNADRFASSGMEPAR